MSPCLTAALLSSIVSGVWAQTCKTTPFDSTWPTSIEWQALNSSIGGALLATTPVASSCWAGNPFHSKVSCNTVDANWTSSIFHATLPESVGATIFANDSCVPPAADTYYPSEGCRLGGLPSYIVNATTEAQVATAAKWAADRDIRLVIKGTGHDLNGRSSGAYALSIWTRHFRELRREREWEVPGSDKTQDVFVIGSGLGWGDILDFALSQGRVVTTGQDPSVGPGGYIQGGGHGPLSSTYGLGAQQVLQATVVTTTGEVLVVNSAQNQDLFWAIRGGGGGQYGIVTEYVITHHPVPERVAFGTLTVAPRVPSGANASWDATAMYLSKLPDLMDAGVAGALTLATGNTIKAFNPAAGNVTVGVAVTQALWAFNKTAAQLDALMKPVVQELRSFASNATLSITYSTSTLANYSAFYGAISGSNTAGGGGVSSSRLLGRAELVDVPRCDLSQYLKRAVAAQNTTAGTYATVGLSGGLGVIDSSPQQWGALLPAWKSAYLHFFVGGASASVNNVTSPQTALAESATWLESSKENLWREWAPNSGAYMNEANPYNSQFKHDFYGDHYEGLLAVKQKYDPTESLYVLSGVGSDGWQYDLQDGTLCRTT